MSVALASVGAVVADRLLGEPPVPLHPVVWFGSAMQRVEATVYADTRRAGVLHAGVGVLLGAGTGLLLRRAAGTGVSTLVAGTVCVAGRMLEREALGVGEPLAAGDLDTARAALSRLVGRETGDLDETAVARATIETVAENTVDAVLGSVWWAAAAGAPGVLAHRAANTMDAMVGHRSARYRRYGWASARLDDAMNLVPARLGVAAVVLARPRAASHIISTVRRDAEQHPSPNGGVIEAAFAAALDVRLGGVNRYGDVVEDRGRLGTGRDPVGSDIERATRLARDVAVTSAAMVLAGSVAVKAVWRCVR
ncbi:adenosylcobinamide-phosphate synthase CbiB [Ilumatobacter coccineus]|uniref:Cobalamin biosynthesis protein CobD n=1 Tax=Ilumatobacter coccineus (strain NBRC 103263 / KCTC 29153 / YM16-304) TaxID=1313172 RepID=A0A6C7EA29_ILUCY|nr:adenosylcobinamide-phosphate synthase CbiB [Ilumatobacter coccineus]BAN01478.1 putative adenosylcobinamide-phosphate synthase [Ilumatobacter coccineus YM16-304]